MTGKKKLCSRFLVIIPDFWAPFLTFLGTFAFSIGRPVGGVVIHKSYNSAENIGKQPRTLENI